MRRGQAQTKTRDSETKGETPTYRVRDRETGRERGGGEGGTCTQTHRSCRETRRLSESQRGKQRKKESETGRERQVERQNSGTKTGTGRDEASGR